MESGTLPALLINICLSEKRELFQFLELASIFQTAIYILIYIDIAWCHDVFTKIVKKFSPSLY